MEHPSLSKHQDDGPGGQEPAFSTDELKLIEDMYWEPLRKLKTRFRDISQLKNISTDEVERAKRCIDLIENRLEALEMTSFIRLTIGLVKENVYRKA